jgi:hypothetical protein
VVAGGIESSSVEKEIVKAFTTIPSKKIISKKKVSKVSGEKNIYQRKENRSKSYLYRYAISPLGTFR